MYYYNLTDVEAGVTNTGSSEVRARRLVTMAGDILLGTVTVPLLGLLTKKTGKLTMYW